MKPIIRWSGGKQRIVSQLMKKLPTGFNNYFEGFCGSCALGLEIMEINPFRNHTFLDVNVELINFYDQIKFTDINTRVKRFFDLSTNKEDYYKIRNLDRDTGFNSLSDKTKALRFFYLNQLCYNGLYRVNSKNQFNVPVDVKRLEKYKPDLKRIDNFKKFLISKSTYFYHGNFLDNYSMLDIEKNDLVYLDPPYHTKYTGYNQDNFNFSDFRKLIIICKHLTSRGVYVMVSYDDFENIDSLLPSEFNVYRLQVPRSISCKGNDRKSVSEVVITNY